MNFIVTPLFDVLAEVMPEIELLSKRARENASKWKSYEETEVDKKIYSRRKSLTKYLKKKDKKKSTSENSIEELITVPPKI